MTVPQKIGRYEVQKELGRGAMGVVYLARDPYMTRLVAIKVMAEEYASDPQFIQRFLAEAKAIANLEHAYIVPVYDFGAHNNQPFLVMRYMSAGALQKYVTADPFSISDTAQIIERISDALDDAHERGIVHRDVKPGNILLDKKGGAFLCDFGLAKFAAGSQHGLGDMYLVGTPEYMSPEQVMGDATDHRSDVYSLGVIVYELLTGKLPYYDNRPMYLVMKHVNEPVPDVLKANPELPEAMGEVIQRAMAKKPSDRYNSAGELAEGLVKAGRGMTSRRARKRWMRDDIDEKLKKVGLG
jgi:serine/threonine-protein kinase